MKRNYPQKNKQPAGGDERKVIATSLVLFILSTLVRHLARRGIRFIAIRKLDQYSRHNHISPKKKKRNSRLLSLLKLQ